MQNDPLTLIATFLNVFVGASVLHKQLVSNFYNHCEVYPATLLSHIRLPAMEN